MTNREQRLRRGHEAIRTILADNPDATLAELMAGADLAEATVIRYLHDLKVTDSSYKPPLLGPLATQSHQEFWGCAAASQHRRIHDPRGSSAMLPDKPRTSEAQRQAERRKRTK